jgi:hypothetical protein
MLKNTVNQTQNQTQKNTNADMEKAKDRHNVALIYTDPGTDADNRYATTIQRKPTDNREQIWKHNTNVIELH